VAEAVKVTNRDLWRMFNALRTLANRRMGNVGADLKVARMLGVLGPLAEPIGGVKQRAVKEALGSAGKDTTGAALSLLNIRAAEAQEEIDAALVEVELPVRFALKEADLPKEMSGEAGWQNAAGLGALVADLGPLYVWPEA
jgi:hypothetical protein